MKLEGVTFERKGHVVLRDLTLRIERGERVAIVGGNGAGKSTLLRLLAGLDRPTAGAVTPCARGSGYVPQGYAESLFPWRSALRNVAMPRLVAGERDALEIARRACATVLPDVDPERSAGRLSGGEKQSIAIARALASPGDAVLADEPLTALSASARERVRAVLKAGLQERTFVLVSHDAEDVAYLCDRVLDLHDGRLEERR